VDAAAAPRLQVLASSTPAFCSVCGGRSKTRSARGRAAAISTAVSLLAKRQGDGGGLAAKILVPLNGLAAHEHPWIRVSSRWLLAGAASRRRRLM